MRMILKYSLVVCMVFLFSLFATAQSVTPIKASRIVMAPTDTSLWKNWKEELIKIRNATKDSIHYSDSLYVKKEFKWAAACYNVSMLMLFDKQFYNAKTRQYTINAFIQDGIKKFGGYDGVVLWHAYPRIGFDERNQFDFYRDFPGGLEGLKAVVKQFHQKGIRVFIDYNPWDKVTRREDKPDMDLLAEIIKAIDADGIFLDTMNESTEEFRKKVNKEKSGIVLESELELPVDRIHNHHMSWAQWYEDSYVPGVLWNKWFERRHILHLIKRWDADHSSELHTAWMNGSGMIVWENVFGTANLWNERDKSILRSMVPVQCRYTTIFSGEGWNPLFKIMLPDVFANEWYNEKYSIWTLVNRSTEERSGLLFSVKNNGLKYFDLITGKETGSILRDSIVINGKIPARGIGAIIAIRKKEINADFKHFLLQQATVYKRQNNDTAKLIVHEELVAAPLVKYAANKVPREMIVIKASDHATTIRYTERECGFYNITNKIGVAKSDSISIVQAVHVSLKTFAIDETLVTNQQYYAFIKATQYRPADTSFFLRHWINNKPPTGKEDHRVVYIDLDDARAYAKWAGKRLLTEQEWQYAAEGPQYTAYPWGNNFEKDFCNNGQFNCTTPVRKFEKGKSSFGCYDMCGNTWEWTESERSDELTRFAIIKGGSFYKLIGSMWYTNTGVQRNDFSAKFILSNPGLNRCSTIGFRCAVDVE